LTYQPGDTIYATIKFEPTVLGVQSRQLVITHSNLPKFQITVEITGEGIGTNYDLSHYDLRFIPEILSRKITVFNNSDNPIYIYEAKAEPEGYFSVTSQLPVNLNPHTNAELEVLWNNWMGEPPYDVKLRLIAGPCAEEKNITLGLYKAASRVSIPDVYADPKGRTSINIDFDNNENHAYNGERFFEGEFTVNPRLFLPDKIISSYGKGQLTKNQIIEDRRIVGFRIEGNFPEQGRVAEIHGIAGLAETDTSHIRMTTTPVFWGSAVSTETSSGIYHLINICGNRLIIHGNMITNLILSPNPTEGKAKIEFESQSAGECRIEIFNTVGVIELISDYLVVNEGKNSLEFDLSILKTGTYNLVIRTGNTFAIARVIIIR